MVLLLSLSDFDVRHHVHSRREVDLGVLVDAADSSHLLAVFQSELLEVGRNWLKTVTNIVFISVAA